MTPALRLTGRINDLGGGLRVRRLLPDAARRAVGPFVFFDHMGPVTLPADANSDVRPHPHIGLATVTYLFEGSFVHRDSLGTVQEITPGAINWMTAGRGIVHSERAPAEAHGQPRGLHGLQLWVALPPALEECAPGFQHVAANDLPVLTLPGKVQVRVLVGHAFGAGSSVKTATPTLYLDVMLPAEVEWTLPNLATEMAVYSPGHDLFLDGALLHAQEMAVLPTDASATLRAGPQDTRLVVIGGAPLERPVRMWWNFVASSRERLAQAAARWATGGFDPIAGETEHIDAPPWRE